MGSSPIIMTIFSIPIWLVLKIINSRKQVTKIQLPNQEHVQFKNNGLNFHQNAFQDKNFKK